MTSKPSSNQPRAAAMSVRRCAEVTWEKDIVVVAMDQDEASIISHGDARKANHPTSALQVGYGDEVTIERLISARGTSGGCSAHLWQSVPAGLRRRGI